MDDITKNIIFTTNTIGNSGQPTTIQYQTADGTILKQPKLEGQKAEPQTFYYATTNGNPTAVNLAQLSTEENKTCYIAQPVGSYNYALVNGMQINQGNTIGIATLDAHGRLQIHQNKPLATTISPLQNTISNISFKCDVCGLMFSHLALLNHHKRVHSQDGSDQQQQQTGQDTITVLNAQNLVQSQNIISENGQIGQIQIVATESLEPVTNNQQHALQQPPLSQQQNVSNSEIISNMTKIHKFDQSKCASCGSSIIAPTSGSKRKNTKLALKCDQCLHTEQTGTHQDISNNQNVGSTQIFVAPDGEIKFEMNDMQNAASDSSLDDTLSPQNVLPHHIHPVNIITSVPQANQQLRSVTPSSHQQHELKTEIVGSGVHTVKKRNAQQLTKCQKCNGSGVIFLGGGPGGQVTKQAHSIKQETPKPFTCNICGGTFSRYSSLWSHKKLHSGEKNYKCSICGLAFAKAVYLKNHARIHTGEKPYKCQTCGMQFSQSPHLKNHERTHSGERPYVCEVCDKGFARHATLWNHRRIHTGEKPYKCDICGSAFSQAAHLKNHAKVHSGEKPFKCDICSAAFADRFALKRHRGIHQKYGQTAPRQAREDNQQQDSHINSQSLETDIQNVVIHKQEITEIEEDNQSEIVISGL